jgi:hypothetical protein
MVGVLAIAVLGALAYVSLKIVRSFMLNLEHAKKMGLPYVIGRKLSFSRCLCGEACEAGASD